MKKPTIDELYGNLPNARKVADGYILDMGDAQFHVLDIHTEAETAGLHENEIFYLPFCTKEEILRMRNQKTSSDYLLWLRAEAIANSPRAIRVFRRRSKSTRDWSLTKYYNDSFPYAGHYMSLAGKGFKEKIAKIPSGMAFINEVNAMCIKSPFGNVIAVNEALSYFLYYMNIVFLGWDLGLKADVISDALAIAVRMVLGSEAMDFDLDPRGTPPKEIHNNIVIHTNTQLMFAFGHEYAHHTLNHLQRGRKSEIRLGNHGISHNSVTIYSYNHKKEYEADLQAIKNVKNNNYARTCLADAAFFLFMYLDIIDHVYQVLSLRQPYSNTHPKPLDRLWRLRKKLKHTIGATKEVIESYLKISEVVKEILATEWLPYHIDELERYGSMYLQSYRTRTLNDREDY